MFKSILFYVFIMISMKFSNNTFKLVYDLAVMSNNVYTYLNHSRWIDLPNYNVNDITIDNNTVKSFLFYNNEMNIISFKGTTTIFGLQEGTFNTDDVDRRQGGSFLIKNILNLIYCQVLIMIDLMIIYIFRVVFIKNLIYINHYAIPLHWSLIKVVLKIVIIILYLLI